MNKAIGGGLPLGSVVAVEEVAAAFDGFANLSLVLGASAGFFSRLDFSQTGKEPS